MRWFKHDSNSLHDAKIEKLIMKYGIEGYGLYFACVEIIASELTPENITFELEHDAEILAHKFKLDSRLVENIMKYCVALKLFEVSVGNRITCLKLATRLDISTSNNPQIKKMLSNNNYQKLLEPNSRSDKIRLDKTKKETKKTPIFKKPSIFEIQAYIAEEKLCLDVEHFWNYYESKGWVIGKSAMKSWKAAVRTWVKNGKKFGTDLTPTTNTSDAKVIRLEGNISAMLETIAHNPGEADSLGSKIESARIEIKRLKNES